MKLVDHKSLPDGKWSFTFDNGNTIILRESWDEVLLCAPVETVERWLLKRYAILFDLMG